MGSAPDRTTVETVIDFELAALRPLGVAIAAVPGICEDERVAECLVDGLGPRTHRVDLTRGRSVSSN